MHEPARLLFRKRAAVRARVDVDVGKARLDVLAHLDRALVQKCFAVIEEVDAVQRRPDLVDDLLEQLEVEHAGLTGARNARLRRADRLVARHVARRRAFDEHPARMAADFKRSLGGRFTGLERTLQRAVATEVRPGMVHRVAQRRHLLAAPDLFDRVRLRVPEHAFRERIRTAAHNAAIAQHDEHVPGPGALEPRSLEVQGHRRLF